MQGAAQGRVDLQGLAPSGEASQAVVSRVAAGREEDQRDRTFLAPQWGWVHPATGVTLSPAATTSGMQPTRHSTGAEARRTQVAPGCRAEAADLLRETRSIMVPISVCKDQEVPPRARKLAAVELLVGRLVQECRCQARWEAEVFLPVHRSITAPIPAKMDQQVPPPAPGKRPTAEGPRAMGQQRCPVRHKLEELLRQRRSIMVLIPDRKEQVVPLKELEAPPPVG